MCWSRNTLASPRPYLSLTPSWTTSSCTSLPRPPIWPTTTATPPPWAGKYILPCIWSCPENWPSTTFPREPRLWPSTTAPSRLFLTLYDAIQCSCYSSQWDIEHGVNHFHISDKDIQSAVLVAWRWAPCGAKSRVLFQTGNVIKLVARKMAQLSPLSLSLSVLVILAFCIFKLHCGCCAYPRSPKWYTRHNILPWINWLSSWVY